MQRDGFRWVLVSVLVVACGDDGGGDSGDTGTTGGTSTSTTSDATSSTTSGSTSTTDDDSTGSTTAVDTGSTGTDTAGIDCDTIPAAPFAATPLRQFDFSGSEDLAFDGLGHIAGRRGSEVVLFTADGTEDVLADIGGEQIYGLRFRANGDLLAANPMGEIIQITPDGTDSQFLDDVGSVNGLYPDFDDNVWYTNFAEVVRVNPDMSADDIVTGNLAGSANGVVYDPDRGLLFYTNYGAGTVHRVPIDDQGSPGTPEEVGPTPGAPDGLSLDACGNLYAVDQQGNQIYRFSLDENGEATGDAEPIIDTPTSDNIANAQFGTGDGFEETSLYAAGNPGTVYQIDVGVPGAPYPTPG